MNQTVWPLAVPLYKGRRTVSCERSTWRALSRTRFSRGSSPVSCPSPFADPVLAGIEAVAAGASRDASARGRATAATDIAASQRTLKKPLFNLNSLLLFFSNSCCRNSSLSRQQYSHAALGSVTGGVH